MPDTDTRSGARRRTARRGPAFFFGLALVYLAALLLLAVGREAGFWFLDDLNDPIAGVLPLGVPWFGALGAVTLSLYGVFDHNDHWDPKWNYWHVARPLVGIVLAIVAYFIFITFIGSTGLTPRTSAVTTTSTTIAETTTTLPPTTETTDQFGFPPAEEEPSTTSPPDQGGGGPAGPSTLLPYYVLAFLVGFREGTFRNLIKRAADVLLGPGDPGAPPAGITVHPAPVDFGEVPAGGEKTVTVTVTNSGTGDLRVYPSRARAPGIDLADEHGVFSLAANAVEGATIAPGANAGLKVEFRPTAPGPYAATLTISSNAGTTPIELRGEGTGPEEQERPRPAPPRRAAGRRLLGRARRRGRRGSPSTG